MLRIWRGSLRFGRLCGGKEQARALNRDGLRVSGNARFFRDACARPTILRISPGLRSRNCGYQGDAGEGVDCWGRELILSGTLDFRPEWSGQRGNHRASTRVDTYPWTTFTKV